MFVSPPELASCLAACATLNSGCMQVPAVQPQEASASASAPAPAPASAPAPAMPDGQPAGAAPSVKEAASAVAAMMQSLPAALDNKVRFGMYVWFTSVESSSGVV